MGTCQYCGQGAGLLRSFHPSCKENYEIGYSRMVQLVAAAAHHGSDDDAARLSDRLELIAKNSAIPRERIREALISGWAAALDLFLDDKSLAPQEEERLMTFATRFSLTPEELNTSGAYGRAAMGATIWELLDGQIPCRLKFKGLPFNLQKEETLVWAFGQSKYYEEKVRREFVGAHHGVSLRVARGVYYRVGGFRGHPVERSELVEIDTGIVGVTSKHLYFAGPKTSLRVPYQKIVSFRPYNDGLGVYRDAASAKQQIFVTGEGWFIYNLVSNLSARSQ